MQSLRDVKRLKDAVYLLSACAVSAADEPQASPTSREMHKLWSELLHNSAEQERSAFLSDLLGLVRVAVVLGGNDLVFEAINAVQDIGEWLL
jgi:hypothetical protein